MSDWNKCQECGGELSEKPGKEFIEAVCSKCGAEHRFDHDDGWFSLGKPDDQTPSVEG